MSTAVVVEDYSFWYRLAPGKRWQALENVSFQIEQGEFVLLMGSSGSGKSTLALNLVGIYPDLLGGWSEGRILLRHPEKGLVPRSQLERGEGFKTINMLFQNPEDQIVTLTVQEEVAFALENYLVPPSEIQDRIDRALDVVGLRGFKDRSTLQLSGGEKQRVALAAMLAMEPTVLILDEPTSNLDPIGTEEVLEAVGRVRERLDLTLLIVEHKADEVLHLVDKVLLLDGKKVLGPFSPHEFVEQHGRDARDRMGLWIPQVAELDVELSARGVRLATTPLTVPELVESVRSLSGWPAGPAPSAPLRAGPSASPPSADGTAPQRRRLLGETVVKVRSVSFSYPAKADVLRDVNLDMRRGELLAIVGQNGSGKSTLAWLMTGILRPTSGHVYVHGKPTTKYKFVQLARQVAYIFQMPEKQFIRNSVQEEMAHGLRALRMPKEEIEERVDRFLNEVDLADEERRQLSPYMLSHGQKRRLSVACMVISEPDVVILDEPTFGQDWRQARRLMELMRSLADKHAAVSFITHDMRLVAEYADRCLAMADGEVIFEGTPSELFGSRSVLEIARLKPPPVHECSRQLIGVPELDVGALGTRIEEVLGGRSRTLV